MNQLNFDIEEAVNEPIKDYLPNSPEKASLKAKLEELKSQTFDIPIIINGQEVRTGNTGNCVMPHNHNHVLTSPMCAAVTGPQKKRTPSSSSSSSSLFIRRSGTYVTHLKQTTRTKQTTKHIIIIRIHFGSSALRLLWPKHVWPKLVWPKLVPHVHGWNHLGRQGACHGRRGKARQGVEHAGRIGHLLCGPIGSDVGGKPCHKII